MKIAEKYLWFGSGILIGGVIFGGIIINLISIGTAATGWLSFGKSPKPIFVQAADLQQLLPASPELSKKCKEILGLKEIWQPADKTNYGFRRPKDLAGGRIPNQPSLIVLHETVLPLDPTLKLFSTPHPNDTQQVSYHLVLARDGSLYRIVADKFRAYGAGWSAWGDSTIRHRGSKIPAAAGSINNVALHISLVSPADGAGNSDGHSGYSNQQYSQLAQQVLLWQLRWGIPMRRVTNHASIDRSHSRSDPRSFRWHLFDRAWQVAAKRCNVNARYSIDARSR